MPDATAEKTVISEKLSEPFQKSSENHPGVLKARFFASDKKALPPYKATIIERCFIIAAVLWAALQGAFYYDASLLPVSWWVGAFAVISVASFSFADCLRWNRPRLSIWMQLTSVLIILFSLYQGARLGLVPPTWAWAPASLALLPAIYVALQRNIELVAIFGYLLALGVPLFYGLEVSNFFFIYCMLLCLPMPLILLLRDWKVLNLVVFGSILAAGLYFLTFSHYHNSMTYAVWASVMFWAVYFLCVLARQAKPSYRILAIGDFVFMVGFAAGGILCQLRIAYLTTGSMFKAAFALTVALVFMGTLSRLVGREQGATLSRVYFLLGLILLNTNLTLLLPASIALALYCLEALILFGLGSKRGWPRVKTGGFILLLLTPIYFFLTQQHILAGTSAIGFSFICCAYLQDRELKRLAMRSGKKPWSSRLEFWFVTLGFTWCFTGLALFTFRNMPSPGLVFFGVSSASAYLFYAIGKLARLRSLRVAIFLPMLVSVPAILLPIIYQSKVEWPILGHLISYNYLTGLGALAWVSYFVTVWTALYHNWGGLISNRTHARLLALVTLELVLVLTSSCRAFALESGVSPSFLSVLAVLPSLVCVFVLSRVYKARKVEDPYRVPLFQAVPCLLFTAVACWFLLALSSPGSAAPAGKYIPILNPVELVQLLALGIFGYWQRRLRKSHLPTAHLGRGAILWTYAVFSFLWLHGVMLRVVQYFSQAQLTEVVGFVEIRVIFACIWAAYGIIIWIGAAYFSSSVSWLIAIILGAAGVLSLVAQAFTLWGSFVAIVLVIAAFAVFVLLLWRSPAPFTKRGRKLAEQSY